MPCILDWTFFIWYPTVLSISTYIATPFPFSSIGILEMEDISLVRPRETLNLAFNAGSSKHGKALLASVGWNWVTAMYLWKGEKFYILNFFFYNFKNGHVVCSCAQLPNSFLCWNFKRKLCQEKYLLIQHELNNVIWNLKRGD